MQEFRTPSRPPSPSVRAVRVLPVPVGAPLVCRFLAGYQGILTHYAKAGPIFCPGPGECPPSTHRGKTVWKGYAPVETWSAPAQVWVPDVLELTERLEEILRGRDLRGEVWILSRVGQGKTSDPVTGVYCEKMSSHDLSPPFDTLPVVQRCYHCLSLKYGAVNPLPGQVLLPAVKGPAPALPSALAPVEVPSISPAEIATLRAKLAEQGFPMSPKSRRGQESVSGNGAGTSPAGH